MEVAARAVPDGYTLFLGNVGTVAINPSFYRDLNVVARSATSSRYRWPSETAGVVVANPKFPPNSLTEMVAYVKAHPGKINLRLIRHQFAEHARDGAIPQGVPGST